jgi:hypothetical protein
VLLDRQQAWIGDADAVLSRKRRNRYPHSAKSEELADALDTFAKTDNNLQQLSYGLLVLPLSIHSQDAMAMRMPHGAGLYIQNPWSYDVLAPGNAKKTKSDQIGGTRELPSSQSPRMPSLPLLPLPSHSRSSMSCISTGPGLPPA